MHLFGNQNNSCMNSRKNHPFPVQAYFKESVVLTFAIPKEQLISKIPYPLELDTFQDEYAFIAIAMVQTKGLRPKGFPSFLGRDFFLVGYRIFVRYKNLQGKSLRGLYILRSETNKKSMEYLGNVFTQYQYHTIDIQQYHQNDQITIESTKGSFSLSYTLENTGLPKLSPFVSWKEARRYAGPLPHTFSVDQEKNSVLIVRGLRQNWKPNPIHIIDFQSTFLNNLGIDSYILSHGFRVIDIPYEWEKGKIELW